ncbi:3-ketoacyl-CoA reductase [Amylocystis lapponica]|nr:3-ketoacyl-CoA reductase [Amylocystis lapponica]
MSFLSNASIQALVGECPTTTLFFLALGSFTFAKFALRAIGVVLQSFVIPGTSLKKYGAGKGAWAVVTGASEGIGREFALQLARKGFNVVVSARNAGALASLVAEIESSAPAGKKVQTKAIPMDFSKLQDEAAWARFAAEVQELDVGVLVNNVGKSHQYVVDFVEAPEQELEDILSINVLATTRVTRMILPGMAQRKRGLVLNMGSFSGGTVASPMLATYGGSKAFLASFTAAVAAEVKSKNVDVQCLNTYFVVSSMSKIRKPNIMTPTAKAYVKAALSKVGLPCGALWSGRPKRLHAVLESRTSRLGEQRVGWKALTIGYTYNLHRDIRRRVLRKLAREAKQQ